jgi:hypothetical protein
MLALETVGFPLIVAITWMDELLDLPHLMLGAARTPVRWGEGILESLLTIAVGMAVVRSATAPSGGSSTSSR